MFKLYHTKAWTLNSLLHFNTEGYKPFKDDYKYVASVVCDDLGEVFGLTNHIDHEWWNNEGVYAVSPLKHRSTSVGDVVVDEDTGKVWLCASCGWDEVVWNEGLKSNDPWWMDKLEDYTMRYAEEMAYKNLAKVDELVEKVNDLSDKVDGLV